jgi:hypothetical protein
MESVEKIPNWFRWILIPIVTVVITLLAAILTNIATKIVLFLGLFGGFSENFYVYLVSPVIVGFCSVYVTFILAPNAKKTTGIIVATMWVLFYGIVAYFSVLNNDWGGLIGVAAAVTGCWLAIYNFDEYAE